MKRLSLQTTYTSFIVMICLFHKHFIKRLHFGKPCGIIPLLNQTLVTTIADRNASPTMFPNITTIIKLLLLTSVTSSGVERANSSLRFIKNVYRSTMGEDRFNALMLLYVHKDIELNIDAIIDSYSRKYPRRMLLIDPICEV